MKKLLVAFLSIVVLLIIFYFYFNRSLQIDDVSEVKTQNIKTITVINTVHKASNVTIKESGSIKQILEFIKSSKYKRTFFIFKPLGSQYALSYEDVSSHKSCTITFIGRDLILIDKKYYYTDKYLNRKILTYLTIKGLTQKIDSYFTNEIQKSINVFNHRYQVDKPKIVSINADMAENNHGPLFLVKVKGSFKKGKKNASFLTFSMLTERTAIWGIRATDNKGKLIWEDKK